MSSTDKTVKDYDGDERRKVVRNRRDRAEQDDEISLDPSERRSGFARRIEDNGLHDWDFD